MGDKTPPSPLKVGMTLDVREGMLEEYKRHHSEIWPEIVSALRQVGLRNITLWSFQRRLFYYAEYVGDEPFEKAMEEYSALPRVQVQHF